MLIGTNYKVETDELNYILSRRHLGKSGKSAGQSTMENLRWLTVD